jgi:predicted Rossmann fold flavoprotein
VLLATGGVTYPKTGSVGDGQRFARDLGHRVLPYRPGLAGIELEPRWLGQRDPISLPDTEVAICCQGRETARAYGEILLDRTCARGPAMVNASRIMARENLRDVTLVVDLFPGQPESDLARRLAGKGNPAAALATILPRPLAREMARDLPPAIGADVLAKRLKEWRLPVLGVRPLKEAMVTVGGVDLATIDANTMESRLCPSLYFAGEVMDVDGPTGGYNLHAAFATARLAVETIAARLGRSLPMPPQPAVRNPRPRRPRRSRQS